MACSEYWATDKFFVSVKGPCEVFDNEADAMRYLLSIPVAGTSPAGTAVLERHYMGDKGRVRRETIALRPLASGYLVR